MKGGKAVEEIVLSQQKCSTEELMEQIMQNYGQEILQLVYTYVKNHAVAEDLTQEIFLKCYKALPQFAGKSSMKTWLWRIAINHTKDYLKNWYNNHVQTNSDIFFNDLNEKTDIEKTVIQRDEDATLAHAVMELPIKYREVIYLFYFEEYALKDMSSILCTNENTIKTRLRKAKKLLKTRLEESEWVES